MTVEGREKVGGRARREVCAVAYGRLDGWPRRLPRTSICWTRDCTHSCPNSLPESVIPECRGSRPSSPPTPLHLVSHSIMLRRLPLTVHAAGCIASCLRSVGTSTAGLPQTRWARGLPKTCYYCYDAILRWCLPPPSSSSTPLCHFLQTPTRTNRQSRETKGKRWYRCT